MPRTITIRTTAESEPALGALQAAALDLRRDRIADAWVEMDNAELALRRQGSLTERQAPAVRKALTALGTAREKLATADLASAGAAIGTAILLLAA